MSEVEVESRLLQLLEKFSQDNECDSEAEDDVEEDKNEIFQLLQQHKDHINWSYIDDFGQCLLHRVVELNHPTLLAMILDCISKDDVSQTIDSNKTTSMHYAAITGNPQILNMVLKACPEYKCMEKCVEYHYNMLVGFADINGCLPLHWAARQGVSNEVISILVEADKTTINSRDIHGWTPLHYAAANSHTSTATHLLELGASKEIQDERGRLPKDLASERGYFALVDIL